MAIAARPSLERTEQSRDDRVAEGHTGDDRAGKAGENDQVGRKRRWGSGVGRRRRIEFLDPGVRAFVFTFG
jgi:hypothetical protein